MFIKKLGGSVVAITAMLAFSAALAADSCLDLADEIANKAGTLICVKDPNGSWPYEAIWQKKGKNGDGCEVHLTLGQQLYVPFDPDQPPLTKNNPKAKGDAQATAKGAAAALRDGKQEAAILHLTNFITTIDYDEIDAIDGAAKLNPSFGTAEGQNAEAWAMYFRDWAKGMRTRVESCTY